MSLVVPVDRKSFAYRAGRKVGAAGRSESLNPYQGGVGENGEWRCGYIEGWWDVGRSNAARRASKVAKKAIIRETESRLQP